MPLKSRPRWHKGKRRWYAAIGEATSVGGKIRRKQVLAPADISENDERAAWRWFEGVTSHLKAVVPFPPRSAEGVALLVERYLVSLRGKVTAKHIRNKRLHLEGLVDDLGPKTAMGSLTTEAVASFLEGMATAGYSAHYRRNVAASIKSFFRWAGLAPLVEKISRPAVTKGGHRYASRAEAAVWLWWTWRQHDRKQIRFRWHRNVILLQRCLIRTGARPHELIRARWQDIRWQGWQDRAGRWCAKIVLPPELWKAGAKTGRERTIFLTAGLTRSLRRHQKRGDGGATNVFVHGPGARGVGREKPWKDGTTLAQSVRRWRQALLEDRAAALKESKKRESKLTPLQRALVSLELSAEGSNRITSYRWRHTVATTLLRAGVDVHTVAELLGTSPEVLFATYSHVLDSHLTSAANSLAYR